MYAFGLAVAAAGCQDLLGLQTITVNGDVGGDLDTSAPPPCGATTFVDDFTAPVACQPGATAWPSLAQVGQNNDTVSILPPNVVHGAAGCSTDQMFEGGAGGVEVQLLGAIEGTDAYAGLQLAGPGVALGVVNGKLKLTDLSTATQYGAVSYDPSRMVWLRIRPGGPGGELIGEYYDGTRWNSVGTSPVQNAPGTISLDSSLDTDPNYDGATVFAQLRVCQ